MARDIIRVRAIAIITNCQKDLKRELSDGERRDLLKDNTYWTSEVIHEVVETLHGKI